MLYFNTALAAAMLPDGKMEIETLTDEKRVQGLLGECHNVANPNHWNTLRAISKKLGVDVETTAKGGRIELRPGDQVLVAQINGLPPTRETREYTEEEVAKCTFSFRMFSLLLDGE